MTGKIITIAQQKGGVGKTLITAHLAVCLAALHGKAVAVRDVDPQGSLGEWFERREERLGEHATGLGFRTSSGRGARREARSMADEYDFVLVDTPPHADLDGRRAISAAGLALVPVQPAHLDIWAMEPTLETAQRANVPVMLVLNRVTARARITDEIAAALAGMGASIAQARLGNRVAFAESIGQGRTVTETRPSSRAAEEIRALAEEVIAADFA